MKKYIFYLVAVLALSSCGNASQNEKPQNTDDKENYSNYSYKVIGLNDSIVSDSIWKMIFTIEGIDQMLLNKDDSTIEIKANRELVNPEELAEEITKRGATIIE